MNNLRKSQGESCRRRIFDSPRPNPLGEQTWLPASRTISVHQHCMMYDLESSVDINLFMIARIFKRIIMPLR